AAVLAPAAPVPKQSTAPADTGCYRGGPARTGYFPGARAPQRPAVLWVYRTDAHPWDPVVADGVVYFGDAAGTVHAIRADTGAAVWVSADPARACVYSPVQVAGRRVYLTSE